MTAIYPERATGGGLVLSGQSRRSVVRGQIERTGRFLISDRYRSPIDSRYHLGSYWAPLNPGYPSLRREYSAPTAPPTGSLEQ
jgi:hypothetical protein